MTTPAVRVRASLGDAYATLPRHTKNRKTLGKSLKTRRALPKREQMHRPQQDMADGHILLHTQSAQRQSHRTDLARIAPRGRRTEGGLRMPIKTEDGARGLSASDATVPHHQLQSNVELLAHARSGIQRALRHVQRTEASGMGPAGQRAINAGLAGEAAVRRTTEKERYGYMTEFFSGPHGESLFPPSYAEVPGATPASTLFQHIPLSEYPLYRQMVRENVPAVFAQRESLLRDPDHRMPRADIPCEMREHLRAFERPPAAGQRLCIRGERCWNMLHPTNSAQAHYIGRGYLSRRELQHLNRTGEYPLPPPDLARRSATFDAAVRSVRMTDTLDTFCAPVTFGKCLNCIKRDFADYMLLVVSRQQEPPIAAVNPFQVECGPGQYRRECCWERTHRGWPTGIEGFFPRLADTTMTEYEVNPASYELDRLERLRTSGTSPMDTDQPHPLLQLLMGRSGSQLAPPPTPHLPDIFEEEFEYEQLLPDGRSTKRVRRRLPRTYFGEFNVGF